MMTLKSKQNISGSFMIDEYAAGWLGHSDRRSICGSDDRKNAICYKDSHPVEYGKVCFISAHLFVD